MNFQVLARICAVLLCTTPTLISCDDQGIDGSGLRILPRNVPELHWGGRLTLLAVREAGEPVTWTSRDERIAEVDSMGTVRAVDLGAVYIVSALRSNPNVRDSVRITVTPGFPESEDFDLLVDVIDHETRLRFKDLIVSGIIDVAVNLRQAPFPRYSNIVVRLGPHEMCSMPVPQTGGVRRVCTIDTIVFPNGSTPLVAGANTNHFTFESRTFFVDISNQH